MNLIIASTIDWPEAAVLIALFALVAFGLYLLER